MGGGSLNLQSLESNFDILAFDWNEMEMEME